MRTGDMHGLTEEYQRQQNAVSKGTQRIEGLEGESRQKKMKCKQADAEERKRSLESISLTASCSGQ